MQESEPTLEPSATTIRNPYWDVSGVHSHYDYTSPHSDLYLYINRWTDMSRFLNVGYSRPWHRHTSVKNHHRLIDRLAHRMLKRGPHSTSMEDRQLLDIASGRGGAAIRAAQTYGLNVTGVDITPYNVEMARRNADIDGVADRTTFVLGDALDLEFASDSFPFVWSIESPAHFPDKPQFLRESYRVLRPGGSFTFADLLVVEEVVERSAENRRIYDEFLEVWDVPYLETRRAYLHHMKESGFARCTSEVVTRQNLRIYDRYCAIFLTLSRIDWLYRRHKETFRKETGADLDNVHEHSLRSHRALKRGMIDYGLFWGRKSF